MPRLTRRCVLACVLAAPLVAGCAGPSRPAWLSLNPNDWSNRGLVDAPVVLAAEGPLAINVQSFNGDVIIKGDPSLANARVTIVREAVHGHGRSKEGAASLADIDAEVQLVPGELGQVLAVRTGTVNAEPHFQRAHVYIEAPDIEGVTVRTSNGRVVAQSVSGSIDVETADGEVRVMTNRPLTQAITILNQNGDINLRMRGESSGRINAETVGGEVSHHVRFGTLIVGPDTRRERLAATLNDGENPIVLRTAGGHIHIAVVSNPEQVGDRIVP